MAVLRRNYRAAAAADIEKIGEALALDKENAAKLRAEGVLIAANVYFHKDMMFLYLETASEGSGIDPDNLDPRDAKPLPEDIFPETSKLLKAWPERDGDRAWCYMYPIYWHDVPEDIAYWRPEITEKKTRRGRIAYLNHDKLFSYVYYHKALVDEGLISGDRYQFIALHEDILFSFFEEPKQFTNIKKTDKESEVIRDWMKEDPESHFDHTLSGKDNFLLLPCLFEV